MDFAIRRSDATNDAIFRKAECAPLFARELWKFTVVLYCSVISFSFSEQREVVEQRPRQKQKSTAVGAFFVFGGDKWTRTTDPLHVKQVL